MPLDTPRRELRAFPRLACASPARLEIHGVDEECQLVDISRGGCKVMPLKLDEVAALDLRLRDPLTVIVGKLRIHAHLAWATPNCSALGCAFDAELSEADFNLVSGKVSG